MKKVYILVLLYVLTMNLSKAQTYPRQWISAYTDTAAGNININDMVTNGAGNNYITGYKIYNGDDYYDTHLFY